MRRPGYLGDIDKFNQISKPRGSSIIDSIKAPLKGIIKATQKGEKKLIRISQPDFIPGMTKSEQENTLKQERIIAIPDIPANHPLYHDLSLLRKKIIASQKAKIAKREDIQRRWKARPEILMRWHQEDEQQEQEYRQRIKVWGIEDKHEKKARAKAAKALRASKNTDTPKRLKAQEAKWAEKDARKRAMRAIEILKKETDTIKKYDKQEKEQLKSDKWYGIVRRIYGWPKRKQPIILI
jgi:hypothetical protein